ncbi:DUF4304 domain-containing protein [Herbiconiux sp. UC225_62]|uniref:DUF4304 domain-containing protein n=1 Tax=Herbiconiux sp. UC225_62 TaxID=3350168 RepID=UPI0036D2BD1C
MTGLVDEMRQVVDVVAPQLKTLGFKKRRHSFNRSLDDGITHVISFQMGASDPPGTVELPGLRPNLHGRFTVNLGVHSSSMPRTQYRELSWINEYDCQLRKRLGHLLPEHADVWWRLDHPEAAVNVSDALLGAGIQWLSRFESSEDIWLAFENGDIESLGMGPAAALDIADLYTAHARPADARRVLEAYARSAHKPSHTEYLVKHLVDRGYSDLAAIARETAPSTMVTQK